jgi:triacylglycerol lipase
MRFNRRQLLWSGLGATTAAVFGREVVKQRAEQAEQAEIEALFDPNALAQEAFQADVLAVQDMATIQTSASLRSPPIPYSRDWSKQLIIASKLATQQYLLGKFQADYDGRIAVLPLYPEGFTTYRQVTSFKATESAQEQIKFEVPRADLAGAGADLGEIQRRLGQTKDSITSQVKQVVQLSQQIPVYYGFLLTSPQANLLIFRGTQRQVEYFEDILAIQGDYVSPVDQTPLGKVHLGFAGLYDEKLAEPVRDAVKSLDPAVPLLISGHSLGAAMATLAAIDLALHRPELGPSLQVYSYGGPRLGDRTFVEAYSQRVPNYYRVVNLADMIPMLPLSRFVLDADFVHGGEQWSFLSHQGDIVPNHIVETYRNAIHQEAETNNGTEFANLRLNLS